VHNLFSYPSTFIQFSAIVPILRRFPDSFHLSIQQATIFFKCLCLALTGRTMLVGLLGAGILLSWTSNLSRAMTFDLFASQLWKPTFRANTLIEFGYRLVECQYLKANMSLLLLALDMTGKWIFFLIHFSTLILDHLFFSLTAGITYPYVSHVRSKSVDDPQPCTRCPSSLSLFSS
jgi:hypothetical protein